MRNTFLLLFALLGACTPAEPVVDETQARTDINEVMDAWHHAAAVADEDVFFGSMQEDAIYLGTDKTERWEKKVFQDWSSKFFERDTAWAFVPHDRVIYFTKNKRTAWFEELLDTWMGPCRGSGVLELEQGKWMIAHYNLTMLIDNDDVKEVLKIIEEQDQQLPVPQDSL